MRPILDYITTSDATQAIIVVVIFLMLMTFLVPRARRQLALDDVRIERERLRGIEISRTRDVVPKRGDYDE